MRFYDMKTGRFLDDEEQEKAIQKKGWNPTVLREQAALSQKNPSGFMPRMDLPVQQAVKWPVPNKALTKKTDTVADSLKWPLPKGQWSRWMEQTKVSMPQFDFTLDDLLNKQGPFSAAEKVYAQNLVKEGQKEHRKKVVNAFTRLQSLSEQDVAQAQKLAELQSRLSSGAAFTSGAVNAMSFGQLKKADQYQSREAQSMANSTYLPARTAAGLAASRNGQTLMDIQAAQNPAAYGTGAFTGESLKYLVTAPLIEEIPIVGKAASKAGQAISSITGGRLSSEVATRLVSGRITDLPFDIINAAQSTDNAGDFIKSVAGDQAFGALTDGALEGLAFGFKKIKAAMKNGQVKNMMNPNAVSDADVDTPTNLPKQQGELPDRNSAGNIKITEPFNIARYRIEIDGAFSGKLPSGSEIIVGKTPDILVKYGAPDVSLHLSQSTARKIAYPTGYLGLEHGHNLGMSVLKNLPFQLEDPVAILKNPQPNAKGLDSLIVITEWYNQDGLRIVSPIHLNAKGAIGFQNNVASTFGADYLDTLLGKDNKNVIYTKNNEDIRKLLSTGVESPKAIADDIFAKNMIPQTATDFNGKNGGKSGTDFDPLTAPLEVAQQARKRAEETAKMFIPPNLRTDDTVKAIDDTAKAVDEVPKVSEIPIGKRLIDAYSQTKAANKELRHFEYKHELSPLDMKKAQLLQEGILTESQIDSPNKANILEYAQLLAKADEAHRPISDYNAARHQALDEQMDSLLQSSDLWKDKRNGFLYGREIMERNIEDIVPDKAEAGRINKALFEPIHVNEANRQRFLNSWRDKVRALNLNKAESQLVQMVGEGRISPKSIPADVDKTKIIQSVKVMRDEVYPQLLELANEALVKNGYRPVKALKNYFPHFSDPNDVLTRALKKLGIDVNFQELPTDIAGRTHDFRPGKQWFSSFMHRTGDRTVYDALEGFDRYIEGVSNVLYHTEDIQRLRAFEQSIRMKYSDAGFRKRVRELRANTDLEPNEREELIEAVFKTKESSHLPHFVTKLREYTDALAGKKAIGDRNMEHNAGRGVYSLCKSLEGRVASNMVAVNPASWLTNFIPLTQAGDVSVWNLLKGMWKTIENNVGALQDGIVDKSTFLTNRRGSTPISRTALEKVSDVLTRPMEWIDNFTSDSIVRARYFQNLEKGIDAGEALREADKYAARLIADRSKGALPTVFNTTNPAKKVLTMFQVETNNQLSFLFKDLPRNTRDKGVKALAGSLAKVAIGAYIFNDVYERIVGRRPAMDPLDMLNNLSGNLTGYEVPNVTEAIQDFVNGDTIEFESDKPVSLSRAGTEIAGQVAENLPFIGGVLGGGRVPVSSAFPDFEKAWLAAAGLGSGEMNPDRAKRQLAKELGKPFYYLLFPTGGGQVKKTIEGGGAFLDGGAYGIDAKGNRQLLFPVPKTPGNFIKGALFGKYALPEGQAYADNGFKPMLTGKETEAMDKVVAAGADPSVFLDVALQFKQQKPDKDADGKILRTSTDKKREILLDNEQLSTEQKKLVESFLIGGKQTSDFQSEDAFIQSQLAGSAGEIWSHAPVQKAFSGDVQTFGQVMEALSKVESDSDEYGNPIPGTARSKKVAAIADALGVDNAKAENAYKAMFETKYSMDDFSTAQRRKYDQGPKADGMPEQEFIQCMNALQGVESSDDARIQALINAGISPNNADYFVYAMFHKKYSLDDFDEKGREAFQSLNQNYGVSQEDFISAANLLQRVDGTVGSNGKTVSGSLKRNRYAALVQSGVDGLTARRILIALYGYKDKDWS